MRSGPSTCHTGFVVEFDIPEHSANNFSITLQQTATYLVPQKVNYEPKRPTIRFNDSDENKYEKQLLTKSLVWEYEQEERVIDFKRGHGIHKYNQNVLRSVIVGVNIGENFNKLKDAISDLNIKNDMQVSLHKVELDPIEYKIFIPTRPELKQTHFQ